MVLFAFSLPLRNPGHVFAHNWHDDKPTMMAVGRRPLFKINCKISKYINVFK